MTDAVVRCKFRLSNVTTDESGQYDTNNKVVMRKTYTLSFRPVMGDYDREAGKYKPTENTKFWEATPSGEFKFMTIKEDAARAFNFGQNYYIDFIPEPLTEGEVVLNATKTAPGT